MTSTGSKKNQNQNSWKGLLVWILIALLLRWQAVEPRWIPSGSMIPTLQIQDRILIEKITPRLCLLYTSPSPRDVEESRMPSSA